MEKSLKEKLVSKMKDDISGSNFVLSGFKGVNVSEMEKLRNDLRSVDYSYNVVKNRLLLIALKDIGIEGFDECLKDTTVLSIQKDKNCFDGFRILVEFSKNSSDKFYVKGGFVDGMIISSDDVLKISALPSKNVLLGKLLSVFQNPLYRVLLSLKNTTQKLLYVLESIKNMKK